MQPPKNQEFDRGFSLEINTHNGRKYARFAHADEMAMWYDQNKIGQPKKKKKGYDDAITAFKNVIAGKN